MCLGKILNTRDSVLSGYPNNEERVENTTFSGVVLYLLYLLNRNKKSGVNGEVKSSKSMLFKTVCPNLVHDSDFRCLNLMNYQ